MGRLVGRVRNRVLIAIGFSLLAASSFWLGNINLQISMRNVILPSVLNGIAISFIFTPLTTAAMGYLRQDQMANATGIYNLMRNLGGSFGIALVSTIIVAPRPGAPGADGGAPDALRPGLCGARWQRPPRR